MINTHKSCFYPPAWLQNIIKMVPVIKASTIINYPGINLTQKYERPLRRKLYNFSEKVLKESK